MLEFFENHWGKIVAGVLALCGIWFVFLLWGFITVAFFVTDPTNIGNFVGAAQNGYTSAVEAATEAVGTVDVDGLTNQANDAVDAAKSVWTNITE